MAAALAFWSIIPKINLIEMNIKPTPSQPINHLNKISLM
jgi:hypothetical protein